MSHWANVAEVPRESAVSTGVVRALCVLVEQTSEIPTAKLLRAADVDLDAADAAGGRVPRVAVYRVCEAAIALTGDPALGLHWAERLTGHTFAPISNLMAYAPTLREAIGAVTRFRRLLTDEVGFDLIESDDLASIRCVPLHGESLVVRQFVAEMVVTSLFKVVCGFGVPQRCMRVSFDHPAPAHRPEYARVFGGVVQFEQPFTGLVFDRSYLDASSPHEDADVHDALRSIAERRILRLTQRTSYTERVRDWLVKRAPTEPASMQAAANALGLSVRSLRRRLASEGKTYKAVTNEAFAITAQHLLRTTSRTIQEIAFQLGFAETSAFHRAFKRRTGMTPQQYRSEQLDRE